MSFDSEAPTIYLNLDGSLSAGRVSVGPGGVVGIDCDNPRFEFAVEFVELIRPYTEVQVVISLAWVKLLPAARINSRLPWELVSRIVACASVVPQAESRVVGGTADPHSIIRHATDNGVKRWLVLQNTAFDTPAGYEQNFLRTEDATGANSPEIRDFLRKWMEDSLRSSE